MGGCVEYGGSGRRRERSGRRRLRGSKKWGRSRSSSWGRSRGWSRSRSRAEIHNFVSKVLKYWQPVNSFIFLQTPMKLIKLVD